MSDTTCPYCGKDLYNYITDMELHEDGDSAIITCSCENRIQVFVNVYISYDLDKVEENKNELFGEEIEAITFLPKKSELFDVANMYWFFIKE